MKKIIFGLLLFFVCGGVYASDLKVSGRVEGGFRILPVKNTTNDLHFIVYRGDYIKFSIDTSLNDPLLAIPDLKIAEKLSPNLSSAPYFKMKQVGRYSFTLGEMAGIIEVVEFARPNYAAVSADESAEIISEINPLILDVRTPLEYQRGHLQNSVLIPVQELQRRWKELETYKDQDVLIYCATGNRSTVASKILMDNGFKRIINMRYGIVDWARKGHPVVK